MANQSIIVIGAGIAGLTASALLAKSGFSVTLLEAHNQIGGCAGTFRRGLYVFDVGATQVAGFEKGGIHERLFRYLNVPLPEAEVLDPSCIIDLNDGSRPINLWHDPSRWKEERQAQFPGSETFWQLCAELHQSNWSFASRDPVLPIRNFWDLSQTFPALGPLNFASGLLTTCSVLDLLKLTGCDGDQRLKKFLDLQLRLYSQENSANTAALYGATVLNISQAPLGLWHIKGSMQELSNTLRQSFLKDGGNLLLRHRVIGLKSHGKSGIWNVEVLDPKNNLLKLISNDIVCTLPPQCLPDLIFKPSRIEKKYMINIQNLKQPSGAIVFYGSLARDRLPPSCPNHLQIACNDPGSLFLSISNDGDGRAPLGQSTITASVFTKVNDWTFLSDSDYKYKKEKEFLKIIKLLEKFLYINPHDWLHKELSTPRSFEKWTGRPQGIVGGLGQRPRNFGPFGLSSRTPLNGLWLCGDSIHPGEGTAGVSQSALMVCRQLMANRGHKLNIPA